MTRLPIGITDGPPLHALTTRLDTGRLEAAWDREISSHALVVGRTGAGKSNLLYALALGALGVGNEVLLLDGKGSATFVAYLDRRGVRAVERTAMGIVGALRDLAKEIDRRYDRLAEAAAKAAATESRPDYDPPPEITVVLDEYITWLHALPAGVRAEMVSLVQNAAMRAREAGIRIVIATQAPNAEQSDAVLPTPLRRQLGLRILLGTEEDAARRIVFGSMADVIGQVDATAKGRGVVALVAGGWVEVQTYQVANPADPELSDAERAAAYRLLPPRTPREGAFGLRVVREEGA